MKKIWLVVILIAILSAAASATDIYVAQSQTGSSNASSCANARASSSLTSSDFLADNVIHLCGTFTGAAGSSMLSIQGSGTSGHPVTILFEPGAVLTSPYWSGTGGAIGCSSKNYVTIDGGSNGVIQNSNNGTSNSNHQASTGVYLNNCNNVTIKNLAINNIYLQVAGSSDTAGADTSGILIDGTSSNVLITRNSIKNVREGVGYAFRGTASNFEVSNNIFNGVEVGIIHAAASAGQFTSVLIHDNDFQGGAYLWDTSSNSFHHNAIHMWDQVSGASTVGVRIYNNYVHGTWGNDQAYLTSTGGTHITSMFYMEQIGGDATLFNNLIVLTGGSLNSTDNGMVFCKYVTGQICKVFNNTFVSSGHDIAWAEQAGVGQVNQFKNNITYNVAYPVYPQDGSSAIAANNNVYFGASNWGPNFMSYSQWQAAGQDANSKNGVDPMLDANYKPQAGSPAINVASNLTGAGISALNFDKAAVPRASTGNWDPGAYESGSSASAPSSPTNLLVVVR